MKKLTSGILITILCIILVGCTRTNNGSMVISKIFTSTRQADNIIELYNNSSDEVDMSSYKIWIYTNGATTVSYEMQLIGIIQPQAYYIIGSSGHSQVDITKDFDLIFASPLPFNGNDVIVLAFNNRAVDVCGTIGLDVDFSRNLTLIRLGQRDDYQPNTNYNQFDYIMYLPELYQYLGNDDHEIKTLEQIYSGPRLDEEYKNRDFLDPDDPTIGYGGAVLVTLSYISDGDTASFNSSGQFSGGSVRYFYINTPEVNGTYVTAQPWGYVASKYNKEYLLNDASSKTIYLQSVAGYSLTDGYSRFLCFVWINEMLSQFLIVSEGLTVRVPISYEDYDLAMHYKDIPYLTYLRFAEERAYLNGWGVYGYPSNPSGERAPDWNYDTNTLATTDPQWQPHLQINW